MICNNCGTKTPEGARFCSKCGADLRRQSATGIPAQQGANAVCLQLSSDFQITKWKEAGLDKPTVINTDKRIVFNKDKLIHKVGKLHDDDIFLLLFRHFTEK